MRPRMANVDTRIVPPIYFWASSAFSSDSVRPVDVVFSMIAGFYCCVFKKMPAVLFVLKY